MKIISFHLFTAILCTLALAKITNHVAHAQSVTRLTSYQGNDLTPAWDPRGVNIAYIRQKTIGQSFYDAYKVDSSGLSSELPLLIGLSTDFGVATTTTWIGSTGFLAVEEAISGFELIKFNIDQGPFERTIANGSDSATTLLLSIDGGGGGGLSKISRNGLVALERISSTGSTGNISIRTGLVSSMTGQATSTFGTPLISTTSGSALYYKGGALNPDGSQYIIAALSGSGHDLILGSTSNAFADINLTNNGSAGFINESPDISPDGKRVVFARSAPNSNGTYDLYVINTDGTGLTQITDTPNFSENRPSWSPDGGSVAFDGIHLTGHESETPALATGETANYNVYIMTLPAVNIVTPKTKLKDPPVVAIDDKKITLTLTPFLKAQFAATAQNLVTTKASAKPKVSFKYKVELTKTGKKKTRTDLVAKKNTVTVKNLKPGNYSVRYRVEITSKTGTKPAVVKNTGFSPRATFTIGS